MKLRNFLFGFFIIILFQLPCSADVFNRGIYFFNRGNYIRSEKYFEEALSTTPQSATLRYYYAASLFYNQKFEQAKEQFTYIVDNYPSSDAAIKSIKVINYMKDSTNINRNRKERIAISQNSNPAVNYPTNHKKIEIDLACYHGSMVVNNVLFNNSTYANLILDTGASYTVISRDFANKLGAYIGTPGYVKVTTANGTVDAPVVKIKSIEVSGMVVENVDAVIQDTGGLFNTSGLLGMSFLDKFKVTIDKQAGKLILEKN